MTSVRRAADVRALDAEAYRAALPELAALIVDAVAAGAGITFLRGPDGVPQSATFFWKDLR